MSSGNALGLELYLTWAHIYLLVKIQPTCHPHLVRLSKPTPTRTRNQYQHPILAKPSYPCAKTSPPEASLRRPKPTQVVSDSFTAVGFEQDKTYSVSNPNRPRAAPTDLEPLLPPKTPKPQIHSFRAAENYYVPLKTVRPLKCCTIESSSLP